jgi:deoxycytidylate deaminase
MSSYHINILNKLCIAAKKSLINQQLAAVILKGPKIVSKLLCNTYRNTCRGYKCGSLHAEANAIINYYNKSLSFDKNKGWCLLSEEGNKKSKLNILVVRINKMGDTCNARPCYNCLNLMKIVGIRKVYYSVSSTQIICEKVKDMVSIDSSSVTQYIDILYNNTQTNTSTTYFENLLIKYFPSKIKKKNLEIFIQYNFSNVLPDHKIIIIKNNIQFINSSKILILKSLII